VKPGVAAGLRSPEVRNASAGAVTVRAVGLVFQAGEAARQNGLHFPKCGQRDSGGDVVTCRHVMPEGLDACGRKNRRAVFVRPKNPITQRPFPSRIRPDFPKGDSNA